MTPKVDEWERKDHKESYVYNDGKNIKINIMKAIPVCAKRLSK